MRLQLRTLVGNADAHAVFVLCPVIQITQADTASHLGVMIKYNERADQGRERWDGARGGGGQGGEGVLTFYPQLLDR